MRSVRIAVTLILLARPCTSSLAAQPLQPNGGSTITVTNNNDTGPGSLPQAVTDAQDGDTIRFNLDPAINFIILGSGLILNKDINIIGPGPDYLSISTSGTFHLFYVMPGHNVTLASFQCFSDGGGSVFNDNANLTIDQCDINGRRPEPGGAIYNDGSISGATLVIRNTRVSGQTMTNGGGIYNTENATVTLIDSNVTSCYANDTGGGIFNLGTLTLLRTYLSGDQAGAALGAAGGTAGGIFNAGNLTITHGNISYNRAGIDGGGLANSGTATITNTALYENVAQPRDNPNGINGAITNRGTLTITNCTISENRANLGGGAIGNSGKSAILTITHSTISENLSTVDSGGIINADGANLQIGHTILNANSVANLFVSASGSVSSLGYNLSSDDAAGLFVSPGDQINTDPLLGPLQSNGGLNEFYPLLDGSPAIDAGDPNFAPPPIYDQRDLGHQRVYNGRIDIGSFEVQPTPSPSALANLSTRLWVGTGDNVGIAGFILRNAAIGLVIRGLGPSLANQGVPDFLADPVLELRDSSGTLVAQNDNWQDDPSHQDDILVALGLAPSNTHEAAICFLSLIIPADAYTAILSGKDGGTGTGLVEVYDVHSTGTDPQLFNISTRGFIQTADQVMIGGFILSEGRQTRVVVRGLGPSLAHSGITNALTDPTLELRDINGILVVANDNWQDDPGSAEELFNLGLQPSDPFEPAIFMITGPGLYTAILAGKNGGTGVGLVEVYNAQTD